MSVASQAEKLYESGDIAGLLRFADECWSDDMTPTTADLAEVARFARVVAYKTSAPTLPLWQARALTAAALSGNFRSLALSLQSYMHAMAGREDYAGAHAVLDLMDRLAKEPAAGGPPSPDLLDRIVAERRAFLYAAAERWYDAIKWYDQAAGLAPAGSRGAAKVAGGAALARWLSGGTDAVAIDAFATLVDVPWPDVSDAASANLAAARAGDRAAAVPFELV